MVLLKAAASLETKLSVLAQAAQHDLSCACGPSTPRRRAANGTWIYPAALPSGQRVPMLKVLQASGCERNCIYCSERLGGQGPALTFLPDELARLFVTLHREGRVFGLFLSSAIRDTARSTMDRVLATAEVLRSRYQYRGYLHLKIIPGADSGQIDRAMALATRVSVNMEAPTRTHLSRIAPNKRFEEHILAAIRQVARAKEEGRFARAGQTTQLVVGAAGEADRDIASAAARLYRDFGLERVYYSAFQPRPGTPSENRPPVPFVREHRLYQVDFLLRSYGFGLDEIQFNAQGGLPLDEDPKLRWARSHPERFPIEVNTAPALELVRFPGIGPRTAKRIVQLRRKERLRSVDALRAAGALCGAASPFVLLDGRRASYQLSIQF
jgi:predicted DNA-binding helix-hairpin-helix protein